VLVSEDVAVELFVDVAVDVSDVVAVVVNVVLSHFRKLPEFLARIALFNSSAVRRQSFLSPKYMPPTHSKVAALPGGPVNSRMMSLSVASVVEHLLSSKKIGRLLLVPHSISPDSPGQCPNKLFNKSA